MGRPTKYKPEYCKKIIKFFTYSPTKEVTIPHYRDGKLTHNDTKLLPNKPKFLIDFELKIGISHDTISKWRKKYPEFAEALKTAKKLNEMTHARGAYLGVYNPTAFIFTMKNIAGWRDRTENTNNNTNTLKGDITVRLVSPNGSKIKSVSI